MDAHERDAVAPTVFGVECSSPRRDHAAGLRPLHGRAPVGRIRGCVRSPMISLSTSSARSRQR